MSNKKKNPTIYAVAESSGISIATISRVLHTPEKVNPETRSIVLDAIDKLGFCPQGRCVFGSFAHPLAMVLLSLAPLDFGHVMCR